MSGTPPSPPPAPNRVIEAMTAPARGVGNMARRLGHYRNVWRAAVAEEKKTPKVKRSRNEREFLPAALEVLESPASPAARATMLTIGAVFVATLTWSIVGKIDTVASATGKIIPGGRVKVVQALEIGVVREIRVKDGQEVKAGDILIVLDPVMTEADRDRMARELVSAQVEVARLGAMMTEHGDPLAQFVPPAGADPALVAASRILLRDRVGEFRARLAGIDGEIARLKSRQAATAAQIVKLEGTEPLLAERVASREALAAKQYGTKVAYLELKQSLLDMRGDIAIARLQLIEAAQAIAAQEDKRRETVASYGAATHDELVKALQRIAAYEKELAKAEERHRLKTLRASVDGTVQQLAVHTIGGIVNASDPLMVVVPNGSVLEVEGMVLNKDIGFVRVGQQAAIKIESFPFTKYGLIEGKVLHISADAIQDKDRGFVYMARVALEKTHIEVGSKRVPLGPGMTVTIEIKTGERRAIEYFLSPLIRSTSDALREQ